ncbi:hypothetical protein HW450_06755 [Corynebacterium hindlerae]|uniref:P22 coat protein-protein 5 domain protein n=1 Tax=Corynebacterium hindlerae TaxID=699041 RepID=A0A7G5FBU9_9CORY|nr:phage capsid protein [Corynebacterium hindlerae]QMV84090.1 hypothetical protein HW450_06755 [Corynebacterium hindlerae]
MASTGLDAFVPELWSAAIAAPFEKSLVFGQAAIVNGEYTGEISRKGDTVHLSSLSAPTVNDYDIERDLEIEDLTVKDNAMKIDQGAYFAFRVNDLDVVQAAGPFKDPATKAAAVALRDKVDKYIAKQIETDAKAKVKADIDKSGTDNSAFAALVALSEKLNLESVPTTGRYVIVGPSLYSALLMDKRFTRVDASGTTDGLRNGIVGRVLGMDVLLSNNVTGAGTKTEKAYAGTPMATAFVSQLNKIETDREEKRFSDIVKGLMIYGAKAYRPEGLAVLTATLSDKPAGVVPGIGG